METFILWISVIGAICIGIMVLAVFFTVLGAVQRRFSRTSIIKLKGAFKDRGLLNIHLNGGKTVNGVRFVGFTDTSSAKGVPYQFDGMVIFEMPDGKRVFLRADSIRMIEEVSAELANG